MLPKSEFTKNVLTVMTGAGMAQAITLVFSPVLTRIFTPEEFGVFYLFSSLADILFIPATGRYEMAVLVPKKEKEAANTVWAAGIIATFFSILLLIIVFLFNQKIGIWLNEPKIGQWLYLLPPTIFIRGWLMSFHYWQNRHKRFKIITGGKIAESTINVSSRIGMGLLQFGTGGLIVGTLLARIGTLGMYIFSILKNDKKYFSAPQISEIKQQVYHFKHFPKDMVPAGLFHTSATQLPPILINYLYTATVVGHFGFMNRIIRTPLSVIGKSFEEVFKQKASEELRDLGNCKKIFYSTLKKLGAIAFVPFLIFYFIAPYIFAFVFGEKWAIAGTYAQIFTLPLFINFITSSLASIFYLKEKTKIFSRLNLLQLSLVIFAFFLSHWYGYEAITLIYILAGAYTISYLMTLFFLVKIVEE